MQSELSGVLHVVEPAASHYLPLHEIVRTVETVIAREDGRLDVVMISGGEPRSIRRSSRSSMRLRRWR